MPAMSMREELHIPVQRHLLERLAWQTQQTYQN
jgi:hypothetical protein